MEKFLINLFQKKNGKNIDVVHMSNISVCTIRMQKEKKSNTQHQKLEIEIEIERLFVCTLLVCVIFCFCGTLFENVCEQSCVVFPSVTQTEFFTLIQHK